MTRYFLECIMQTNAFRMTLKPLYKGIMFEVVIKSISKFHIILFISSSFHRKYLKLTKLDITSFATKLFKNNLSNDIEISKRMLITFNEGSVANVVNDII